MKFTVVIENVEDLVWLEHDCERAGVSKREWFRMLVTAARTGALPAPGTQAASAAGSTTGEPAGRAAKPRKTRGALLEALETCPRLELAAHDLGISQGKLSSWLSEPAFSAKCDEATRRAVYRIERELLEVGGGRKKGNHHALLGALAALDEGYGLLRQQYLKRILGSYAKELLEVLRAELPIPRLEQVAQKLVKLERDACSKLV